MRVLFTGGMSRLAAKIHRHVIGQEAWEIVSGRESRGGYIATVSDDVWVETGCL